MAPLRAAIVGGGLEPTAVAVVATVVKDPTLATGAAGGLTPKEKDDRGIKAGGGEVDGGTTVGPLLRPKQRQAPQRGRRWKWQWRGRGGGGRTKAMKIEDAGMP